MKIKFKFALILFCLACGMGLGAFSKSDSLLKEALHWDKLPGGAVQCRLCPRQCAIGEGKRGYCRTRENRRGKLYAMSYGKACALGLEPIEKAPFYHFYPGHTRLVIATAGCNMGCKFCQNWSIAQKTPEEVRYEYMTPEAVVDAALKGGAKSICFTFTEPVTYYEYMLDIARLAKKKGLKTAVVSNGYINPKPLAELLDTLDAIKIDLKGFTDEFYRDTCNAQLQPVLNSIKQAKKSGKWLEIVNLVIPTLNDNPKDIKAMSQWLVKELGPDVPLHFTRFSPMYKLSRLPPTPVETLEAARALALAKGMYYVYIGNVPGNPANNTYCPKCGKTVIARNQFEVLENNTVKGKCKFCGAGIKGLLQ